MRILFISVAPDVQGDHGLSHILKGNTVELVTGAVDRAGLERALRAEQYDVIHFVGHGAKGVIGLTDGELDSYDFASMCEVQRALKFVFVNACNSLSLGVILHNALHVPIVCHDEAVRVPAAIRFAEVFYRAYAVGNEVAAAFDKGRNTLISQYRDQAASPQLVNGDMATRAQISDLRAELTEAYHHFNDRMDTFGGDIKELKADMKRLHQPNRMNIVMALIGALLLAQLLTPWLNALLNR